MFKIENYRILGRIGEGAHGVVFKAKHIESGDLVALKKVILKKIEEGIPNSALREIKALQEIEEHENIVKLREVIPQGMGFILSFEFMITDLSELIKDFRNPLQENQVKCYMLMLLEGIAFCHSINIMHRDLKPANLLISSKGILKIADFGLARVFDKSDSTKLYSHQVATRWYRCPELLFGSRKYDEGVDLWAVGCIFGEMLNFSPLFPGETDIEQICCVMKILGEPDESWPDKADLPDYNKISFPHFSGIPFKEILPEASQNALNLLESFLNYDSSKRLKAKIALVHDYFFAHPLPLDPLQMPIPPKKSQEDTEPVFNPQEPITNFLPILKYI